MTRFLARRLLNYVVLLGLASFVAFTLTSLTFSPLDSLLERNPRPPQAVIDAKAAELNLNKPIPVRYADWLAGAVRGDFGTTVAGQPVTEELWREVAPRIGIEATTISLRPYPAADAALVASYAQASTDVEWLKQMVGALRRIRSELGVPPSKQGREPRPRSQRTRADGWIRGRWLAVRRWP